MTDLDLRNRESETVRSALFDALASADPGDDLAVVADADLDTHLLRYQIDHDRVLLWEYDDPDEQPRELRIQKAEKLEGYGSIDVRDLKPQRRHEALLSIFDELEPGEGFVLVNDHDPKPLYHELRSMHGAVIEWNYRSEGGEDGWRVEITKTGHSEGGADEVVTKYDVREIPKPERHPTLHHRYGMLPEGGIMELIAPHEPRPLHQEFRQRYGDAFTWEVIEQEPGRCRVHITKEGAADEDTADVSDADRHHTCDAHEDETGDDVAAGTRDAGPADSLEIIDELDVRDLPPAQRHQKIFAAYDDLGAGEAFVLVNDHDPKPLYHQFDAEAGPAFRWAYRQEEPGEYRVRVGKAAGVSEADGGLE